MSRLAARRLMLPSLYVAHGAAACLLAALLLVPNGAAMADRIRNPVAVFNGLDKITGRIVSFEVRQDETVQFGALHLTPRACYTRPPTEAPNTTAFLEVDEVNVDGEAKRIFTGWVFAASPGLHGIEHPVYDIWLTDCKGGAIPVAAAPQATPETEGAQPTDIPPLPPPRPAFREMDEFGMPEGAPISPEEWLRQDWQEEAAPPDPFTPPFGE